MPETLSGATTGVVPTDPVVMRFGHKTYPSRVRYHWLILNQGAAYGICGVHTQQERAQAMLAHAKIRITQWYRLSRGGRGE